MNTAGATTCGNPSCEDGWIGLRNLTAPARPCLDCNPGGSSHRGRVPSERVEPTESASVITGTSSEEIERMKSKIRELTETRDSAVFDAKTEIIEVKSMLRDAIRQRNKLHDIILGLELLFMHDVSTIRHGLVKASSAATRIVKEST